MSSTHQTPAFLAPALLRATPFPTSLAPAARALPRAVPRPARRALALPRCSAEITTEQQGQSETLEFRLFFKKGSHQVSPWHDIPLYANKEKTIFNYVNEIPRGTSAKMEIATDEEKTPIKQDVKKGALRYYKYSPSLINYGALPQTWEDPNDLHVDTKCGGDNDPVDCIEIGSKTMPMGAVYQVKPLGLLALIDEDETDWKVIAINTADPTASRIHTLDDVEREFPGTLHSVREWFRLYKTAEGKGENTYAFGGEAKDIEYTLKVVAETHESWKKLRSGEIPNEDELWLGK